MTDDRVETHVAVADPDSPSGRRVIHFQEYWVRLRAEVPAEAVARRSARTTSTPAPGVLEAIADGRPRRPAAVQPGRLGRHHPRRARHPRRRPPTTAHRSSASPPSSAAPTCAAWPRQLLTGIGVEVSAGAVGAPLRRPVRRRRPRRLAGRHRRRRRRSPRLEAGRDPRRGRPAHDDRPRRDRGDGRGGRRRWSVVTPARGLGPRRAARGRRRRRPGRAGPRRDDDLADGDVVASPARWSARPRAASGRATARRPSTEETVRVVARRGPTRIVRNRLGLTMAAAGVDASNVAPGSVVLLPLDPDASARGAPRRGARAHRHQRRRGRHRHRRPRLARGPDRHRHRCRRAGRRRGLRRPRPTPTATRWP